LLGCKGVQNHAHLSMPASTNSKGSAIVERLYALLSTLSCALTIDSGMLPPTPRAVPAGGWGWRVRCGGVRWSEGLEAAACGSLSSLPVGGAGADARREHARARCGVQEAGRR
jgi:hypothetical protein